MTALSLQCTSLDQNTWAQLTEEWEWGAIQSLFKERNWTLCLTWEVLSTGHFHRQSNPDINQWTCWQSPGEFNRGNDLIDMNNNNVCTANTKDQKAFSFYWPWEGCYQPLEILISVFWSMSVSQAKAGKTTAAQKDGSSRGKESLVPSPKPRDCPRLTSSVLHILQKILLFPGAVFRIASQSYLGRISKQDLIDVV